MILRWYGNGQQAAWQALLLISAVVTVVLLVQDLLRRRTRSASRPAALRTLAVDSAEPPDPHRLWAPVRPDVRQPVRQPAMATSPVSTAYSRGAGASSIRAYDTQGDPHDVVRQMRSAATRRGPLSGGARNPIILLPALLIINPVGLWLTWGERSLNRQTKLMLSAVSALWYLGVAGFAFALMHR
jgi:hypothetical protein